MIKFPGFTVQSYSIRVGWWFLYPFFFPRAFGDKSGPPSLPDAESEGQGMSEEEYEANEEEKEKEEVEKCVEEEEQSPGETVTDQVSSCIEELSLAEQEEEKGEKGNEEEDENHYEQKTPQGTRLFTSPIMHVNMQFQSKLFQVLDLALTYLPPQLC